MRVIMRVIDNFFQSNSCVRYFFSSIRNLTRIPNLPFMHDCILRISVLDIPSLLLLPLPLRHLCRSFLFQGSVIHTLTRPFMQPHLLQTAPPHSLPPPRGRSHQRPGGRRRRIRRRRRRRRRIRVRILINNPKRTQRQRSRCTPRPSARVGDGVVSDGFGGGVGRWAGCHGRVRVGGRVGSGCGVGGCGGGLGLGI